MKKRKVTALDAVCAVGEERANIMPVNKKNSTRSVQQNTKSEGKSQMYESGEDYIETIYRLKRKNGFVRSVDVARELGYSRPSVSRAVSILKKDGYLVMDTDGELELTAKGKRKATKVYDKHKTLTKFLMKTAGVSAKTAENDACRIEHIISETTFNGIKKFMKQNLTENQTEEEESED